MDMARSHVSEAPEYRARMRVRRVAVAVKLTMQSASSPHWPLVHACGDETALTVDGSEAAQREPEGEHRLLVHGLAGKHTGTILVA